MEFRIITEQSTREAEFLAGNLDYIVLGDAQYAKYSKDPQWKEYLLEVPELFTRHFGFNVTKGPLKDVRVRQAMAWAKTRPEAFSERTGKPDTRGAYGLLAREVIALLKHLQHAQAKTVIFVGILEKVTDELNRTVWQPQLEGGKAGRDLPGIVDQVISMSLFVADGEGFRHEPERGAVRRLVCRPNPYGLPAKDRSGRLDVTEPADLCALLTKINASKIRMIPCPST